MAFQHDQYIILLDYSLLVGKMCEMIQAFLDVTGEGTNGIGALFISDAERKKLAKKVFSFIFIHLLIVSWLQVSCLWKDCWLDVAYSRRNITFLTPYQIVCYVKTSK